MEIKEKVCYDKKYKCRITHEIHKRMLQTPWGSKSISKIWMEANYESNKIPLEYF